MDFKRDRLRRIENGKIEDTEKYRGSLFSNQELAIAAYLNIECIAFQEQGIRELEGILGFIQANCVSFTDRNSLLGQIVDKIKEKIVNQEWDPHWRNELYLERDGNEFEDVWDFSEQKTLWRWYHAKIKNLHNRKLARNCVAYLERISNKQTCENTFPELVEFKWKGVISSSVVIPPRKFRHLDVLKVMHEKPNEARLAYNKFLVDYTGYHGLYTIQGPGVYELTFALFSEDFPPSRQKLSFKIGKSLNDISLNISEGENSSRP